MTVQVKNQHEAISHAVKAYAEAISTGPAFSYEEGGDLTGFVVFVNGEEKPEGRPPAPYTNQADVAARTMLAISNYANSVGKYRELTWRAEPAFDTYSDQINFRVRLRFTEIAL